jgi:hypothetical protein
MRRIQTMNENLPFLTAWIEKRHNASQKDRDYRERSKDQLVLEHIGDAPKPVVAAYCLSIWRVPLKQENYAAVINMIEDIERDPSSSEFLSALRMREWDLDSDLDKVKRPMDLYTVKAQLLNGDYHTYENCFADIQLIWDNCK